VHGVNGVWGVLSLGLFANGVYGEGLNGVPNGVTGLFYGDGGQFLAECIGVLANVVYVGGVGALAFWAIGKMVGNRVSEQDELGGLDMPEMGVHGYSSDPGPMPGAAAGGSRPERLGVPSVSPAPHAGR
jgi:ammonium transporter, Amt family